MSHSINYQFVHLLWGTKRLLPLINVGSQESLTAYIGGILIKLGGVLIASTNTSNHIHLLIIAPTTLSMSELLYQMKAYSSKWYKRKDDHHSNFSWNEGYSAFTVSPAALDNVKQYFLNELERHQKQTFEEELFYFLNLQQIDSNPNFLVNTTHTKLIYHLIWSVKNRDGLLSASVKAPLYQSMSQVIQENECKLHAIGNVADHIHLLLECSKKTATADLVQQLKTTTTHLIRSQSMSNTNFNWQEGYGSFSVGIPAFERVLDYVNNQEAHHTSTSFEHEWDKLKKMDHLSL